MDEVVLHRDIDGAPSAIVRFCVPNLLGCTPLLAGSNQQYLQYAELTAGMESSEWSSKLEILYRIFVDLFEVLQDVAMWGAKTVQRGNDTLR